MAEVQDGRIVSGHEDYYGRILAAGARIPSPAKEKGEGHLMEFLLFSSIGLITLLVILRFLSRENANSY
ncbi:hypothetical protein [Cytobacillus firmus]|uniref:Uncharacterized protein n=1 Tax=Cytobacillus firmus DS1 TaxID=1307436 RepID=W7LCW1_CYTFI|nr:hypothetical protein [Cytobacillus firmus]EWG13056.1 hypothetical protein PBF_01495 [Cytobacillus firmus DS1]